jgi:hypothetical protein
MASEQLSLNLTFGWPWGLGEVHCCSVTFPNFT